MNQTAVQRSYKNSLFREKTELLSLYNALNGKDYVNPEALTITTIEDVLYMGLKNDISFLIEDVMNLYEGQSSWNPSMPLRGLFYISQIYQGYVKEQHLEDVYKRQDMDPERLKHRKCLPLDPALAEDPHQMPQS